MNADTVSRKLREISRLLNEVAAEIEDHPAEPQRPVQVLPTVERKENRSPRMRTIPKAVEEIKAKDPNTSVTYWALRRWVKAGKIRSFDGGKSPLVDLDEVERMVEGGRSDGVH